MHTGALFADYFVQPGVPPRTDLITIRQAPRAGVKGVLDYLDYFILAQSWTYMCFSKDFKHKDLKVLGFRYKSLHITTVQSCQWSVICNGWMREFSVINKSCNAELQKFNQFKQL